MKSTIHLSYRIARRVAVLVVGTSVVLVGIVMIVMPGPAFIVIPAGLAILGIEFAWARRWLGKLRRSISDQMSGARGARAESHRDRYRE
jgi:uncharacterized protein (TIGR02611 family)